MKILSRAALITLYFFHMAAFSAKLPEKPTIEQIMDDVGKVLSTASAFKNLQNPKLCAPLAKASGRIISVNPGQVSQLRRIAANSLPGDTILLEDGLYQLKGNYLWFSKPGVTLRSASGNPASVVLDGGYKTTGIITIAASDITIAEITISHARTHPIHVISSESGNAENTLIYRVNIIDPREQAIKINPRKKGGFTDNGTIACSTLVMTEHGRTQVNSNASACYTGGIDAHQSRNWIIRDNLIQGFWCQHGLSEYAIHFWRGGRDTLIERNHLKDNARGIGLGLMKKGKARTYSDNACPTSGGGYIGHYGGNIKNNFISASSPALFASSAGFDCGICLWSACGATVTHNSIFSTGDNFSSIEWRFPATRNILIENNIVSHVLRRRNGASARLKNNLKNAPSRLFNAPEKGDLHLKSSASQAIDNATSIYNGEIDYDIDYEKRLVAPDIGADEFYPQ
jgi:hypothetical protein